MLDMTDLLITINDDYRREFSRCMRCSKKNVDIGYKAFKLLFGQLQHLYPDIVKAGGFKPSWLRLILAVAHEHGLSVRQNDDTSCTLLGEAIIYLNKQQIDYENNYNITTGQYRIILPHDELSTLFII